MPPCNIGFFLRKGKLQVEYQKIRFSQHSVVRMFERQLKKDDIISVIQEGEVIADYPDDLPYPSKLILGHIYDLPLHVVLGYNIEDDMAIIITAYIPTCDVWEDDFKKRRK